MDLEERQDKLFFYEPGKLKNKKKILQLEKAETSSLIRSFQEYIRTNDRKKVLNDLFHKYRERYLKNN